jgi:hypothetical protein
MSHRPSNGVNGCSEQSTSFPLHTRFGRYRRTTQRIAWQRDGAGQSAATAADIIDSPLKPAIFTLEPYRPIGQVCMTGTANLRVAGHTTLSPSLRVGRAGAAQWCLAAAPGLGFALFVQQLVTQNAPYSRILQPWADSLES